MRGQSCAASRSGFDRSPFAWAGSIEGTADYYRALYAVVEPSAELTEARRIACETFEMTPLPFSPHLSLLYGNFGEARREALVTVLGGWLGVSFTASAVDLVSAARDVPIDGRDRRGD